MPRKRKPQEQLPPLQQPVAQVAAKLVRAFRALKVDSRWTAAEVDTKINAAVGELIRWREPQVAKPEPKPDLVSAEFAAELAADEKHFGGKGLGLPEKGRPVSLPSQLAAMLELEYNSLTGVEAGFGTHPKSHKGTGKFSKLVEAVMAALESPPTWKAERAARRAKEEGRKLGPPDEIEAWETVRRVKFGNLAKIITPRRRP